MFEFEYVLIFNERVSGGISFSSSSIVSLKTINVDYNYINFLRLEWFFFKGF